MQETSAQFEQRKKDHIRIALEPQSQASVSNGLERVQLLHEALPEINFSEVSIEKTLFSQKLASPIFISSMTAGHVEGQRLNQMLVEAAQARGWAMGVGSQRKELFDESASQEWKVLRRNAPRALLFGNLGLAQLIQTETYFVQKMVDNLQASALFIHTNPLQEVLQAEGTPQFRGGFEALKKLCETLSVPVILKEVGCGFSAPTLQRLKDVGVYAVDVAGLGGTHWGRIEGNRASAGSLQQRAAPAFANWGIPTVESLRSAKELDLPFQIWASGGLRTGLDVAKLVAMGAEMVGIAKLALDALMQGEQQLAMLMDQLEFELKVALFCTGCQNLAELQAKRVWTWN